MTQFNSDDDLPKFADEELENIDAWAARQFDASPTTWNAGDFDQFAQSTLATRQRLAELQWVHGLLSELQLSSQQTLTERIQRAMQALPELPGEQQQPQPLGPAIATSLQEPGRTQTQRRAPKWSRWAIAAAVLLCVGLFRQTGGGGSPAEAAVEQALQKAAEHRDREFQVTAELQPADAGHVQRIESQLYVRGPNEFVLNHPGLLPGARLWIGTDGQTIWAVPQIGPILVSRENGPLTEWRKQFQISTPYLQLTTVLTNLRDRFAVQELPPESLASTGREAVLQRFRRIHGIRLVGERQTESRFAKLLPESIDLWVHPSTGEVRRLVLEWPGPPSGVSQGLRRVTFDLMNLNPQQPDWYQHQVHHRPERRVIRSRAAN